MTADPDDSSGPRILVVGASWVGDMVMAQALFMALRQRHPGCRITVLAPAWSRPLLPLCHVFPGRGRPGKSC